MDRDAVVRSVRTGRGSRARRRGRHPLRLSSVWILPADSNATLLPRVAPSSSEEFGAAASGRQPNRWDATKRAEQRISFVAGNLDMGPKVVSFQHRPSGRWVGLLFGGVMRKPRPATYNPAQALHLIASDRTGSPLSCPSCSGNIERSPSLTPPAPHSHVTLKCTACGRVARYIAGAA
jgi:hypothetical protein